MFFNKKNIPKIFLILCLLILLVYVTNITSIPDSVILFQDEELNLKEIFGIKIEETIETSSQITRIEKLSNQNESKQKTYKLNLLGFNLKTITADVLQTTKVKPLGNLVGIKLNTKGVLVVGTSSVEGEDKNIYKPYEESGIEVGDSIIEVNSEEINTTEELIECVAKAKGEEMKVKYTKDDEILETTIRPIKTSENTYKIGIWVRDTAAGIGTLSFYNEETNSIAALGHGIQDIDTERLVEISSGEFTTAQILNINKGEENNPGKIEGSIDNAERISSIYSNTQYGVYGTAENLSELNLNEIEEVEVASRKEIKTGKATVICNLDGERKEYEIEIQKIYTNNNKDNKSMIIKITDEELINKTGGIIQGMSGSPIIQNGKFIGAMTHVFVNDPTKGYAVFGDIMVSQLK